MKKFLSLVSAAAILLSLLLTLASCGKKYEPQESTEEEKRVVMTLNIDKKSYDIRYELYRAFFLTYKEEIANAEPDAWISDKKDEYIEKINKRIIDSISEIYSAFYLCDKLGVNIFSSAYDDEIEEYIDQSVKNIIIQSELEDDEKIDEKKAYQIYLQRLKESGWTYEAHLLIYRYELALAEIDEYYLGTFDPQSPNPNDKTGNLEYTKDDVTDYYNSDESVRIIEAFISTDASNAESRAEALRQKMAEKAAQGKISEMINIIVSSSLADENEIKNGMMLGRYEFDRMYWKNYTDAAFSLNVGEVSEIVTVNYNGGSGYFIIYKCDKEQGYFDSEYADIEYSYRKNAVSKMREDIRTSLAAGAVMTDIYSSIVHSDISI